MTCLSVAAFVALMGFSGPEGALVGPLIWMDNGQWLWVRRPGGYLCFGGELA